MSNRGTASVGSWVELQGAVLRQMPRPEEFSQYVLDGWLQNQAGLKKVLAEALLPPLETSIVNPSEMFARQLQKQEDFFKKFFGFKLELGGVKIPAYQQGFDRLVIVPQEFAEPWKLGNGTPKVQPQNWIFSVCKQHFKCWRYAEDLDVVIPKHDRYPQNGTYAILVRDRQEADEENKNLPARHFWDNNIPTEGSIERMLHELKYWDETKKHLDVKSWSLLPGSRYSDGNVPRACWGDSEFNIHRCNPDYSRVDFRARSVVSSS